MAALPLRLLVPIMAFRIVGHRHPIPTELDKGPCPDGRADYLPRISR